MIAVLTADIINSEGHASIKWMPEVKKILNQWGGTPQVWEIYRGDEIQLKTPLKDALKAAILLKATVKSIKGLDVRIGLGIGEESYQGGSVSESNGTAYQRSGRTLESLKKNKVNLMLATADENYNNTLNLMLKLASDFMDDWSPVSAEIIKMNILNPVASQQEMAKELQIKQSAISQRKKRARWHLVQEILGYYLNTIDTVDK
ncbi:hypothetical protein [Maribacter sp. HTCC2170]|uniref:hypothetical protein n=1 Tax=Maribacter sp. (strain HTCC2170 / KCCM 42371) TaxID=313603 RepID=UPI00006B4874|nr:hypothetical protein [Maribacter sp. HTCC2170]EAR01580.1 hypothetical protein FB2170_13668 [Maribacter sp. HTCC2170]